MDEGVFDLFVKLFYKTSHLFADGLLFEIRSGWFCGPCNAHRAWCVSFRNMFGALPAFKQVPGAVGVLALPTLKLAPG